MKLNRQICKCGNHEIEVGDEIMTFSSSVGRLASDVLTNTKIILKSYKFNIHYLVHRDEWHFQQFDNPKDAADFCRSNLINNQNYKIFHQISADVTGRNETVARQINVRTCRQMANDKAILQQNNIQTAYKLVLKLWSFNSNAIRNSEAKNKIEA